MPGVVLLNQPGVYLVDAAGNVVTLPDGATIGAAEAFLLAGKDGTVARIVRVDADGTIRFDPTGTTTQPVSGVGLFQVVPPYLQERFDFVSKTLAYSGRAPRGSATSAAVWTIKRMISTSSGNPLSIEWTSATAIWDDRATSLYT